MNIMELGALGEMVGGAAVLITLVYLALQVRQGNQVERGETHRAFVSDWNQQVLGPFADPYTGPLLRRANRSFDTLSGDEKMAVTGLWGSQIFLTEELFALHRAGALDDDIWEAAALRMASMFLMPGPAAWWTKAQGFFSAPFVEHVNARMFGANRPTPMQETLDWLVGDERETTAGAPNRP